jgi:ribosomal protein S12 methylthiotransferase accessory factor
MATTGTSVAAASVSTQAGERSLSLSAALARGLSAARSLDLNVDLRSALNGSPGVWECHLTRAGEQVPFGFGAGKGDPESARVGALFEALEHYVTSLVGRRTGDVVLRHSHEVAVDPLSSAVGVSILAELDDGLLGCVSYRSLTDGHELPVPLFLSTPSYVMSDDLRRAVGDRYDYGVAGRYSSNNGCAAGATPVEAAVHALNEVVERDALSLLLIEQFVAKAGTPMRVVDPATLPADLVALLDRAATQTGALVTLVDMTTDLGVPAYLAYAPPAPGRTARIRGCGASLSRHYAIARAVTELIQVDLLSRTRSVGAAEREQVLAGNDELAAYPPLHACYRSDFTERLLTATTVTYTPTTAPATPEDHLEALIATLTGHGHSPLLREQYVTDDIAVVHVMVPGLEEFMIIADGQFVVPGARGLRTARQT